MIHTTRLNNSELVLNSDLIEHIEATPDTVITLINGKKWIVQESVEELVARVVAYQRAARNSAVNPALAALYHEAQAEGD